MSNMAGNPHAEASHKSLIRIEGKTLLYKEVDAIQQGAQVAATLAVAFELRTANLQAERSWATGEGDTDRIYELDELISARLGKDAS